MGVNMAIYNTSTSVIILVSYSPPPFFDWFNKENTTGLRIKNTKHPLSIMIVIKRNCY